MAIATDKALRLNGDLPSDLHLHLHGRDNIEGIDELAKVLSRALLTNLE